MALEDHWPLFGLRITTPNLVLRCPTDADLESLIDLIDGGLHDPATMPFVQPFTDVEPPRRNWESLQYWWNARAIQSAEKWDLALAVEHEGRIVGVQNLMAKDFVTLRTTETGSWLGMAHQGKGIGKEMRRAALHLAFEHLGAEAVVSSAFRDNEPSQRVSLAVGYEPNGVSFLKRRGERGESNWFLLTKERWQDVRPDFPIDVTGFDPCRPLFGLD